MAVIVICEDGVSRHDAPFETRAQAAEFANWGHCCINRHRIVTTDGVELGITTTEEVAR
jgi:hypothetical protein